MRSYDMSTAPPPSSSLSVQFARFRDQFPPTEFEYEGVEWTYTAAGSGNQGLLLFPGAAGGGEAYFPLVPLVKQSYRLMMIRYPIVDSLEQLLGGLLAILDREGISKTAVVGGSAGGLVAQAFLLSHPDRTTRAVLTVTAPPSPERATENLKWLPVVRLIPMPVFRFLMRIVIRKLMKRVEIEREFWTRFYLDAVNSLTRADLDARYNFEIPFDQEYAERLSVLEDWNGEILILQGAEDSMLKKQRRPTLEEAYPKATVLTFEGAGHGLSLERPDEWRQTVCEFLLRQAPTDS